VRQKKLTARDSILGVIGEALDGLTQEHEASHHRREFLQSRKQLRLANYEP
jgi:hypothetical protein